MLDVNRRPAATCCHGTGSFHGLLFSLLLLLLRFLSEASCSGVSVSIRFFSLLKLQKSSAVIPAGSLGALTNSCLCVTKLPCSESDLITIMCQYLVNLFLLEAFPNPQEHYFHAFISLGWDLTLQLLWVNACRSRSCWRGWEHSPLIPFQ